MNKILVTGANGFVGSSLCETLHRRGVDFVAAVRNADLNGQISVGGLGPDTDWTAALEGCDVVIHLAARVHVMNDSASDPLAAFRAVNVDATMNLARQALAKGIKRFVFVSSVKVNGEETTTHPFTAFDEPAPIEPYGQSKLEAEIALRRLGKATGLEVVIVRPPLVYGPGVRANFRRLMQLVKAGVPLPLGAIHNLRSMVAVDNLVDLLILCARHPAAAGQIFMVSDDHDVGISELLRMLAAAMGKRSLLLPLSAGLIASVAVAFGKSAVARRLLGSLQVDINHTKSTLQWQPPVSMEFALKKTVANYRAHPLLALMKKIFDLMLAILASLVLLVPIGLVSLFVKLTSQGPVVYWSDRVGRDNKIFRMPKFRTMRIDTPAVATHLLSNPEQFLTPIGSFLRRSSLDELPQLWSILCGDMSFVGPRPALFNQEDLIGLRTRYGVHQMTPGLTGWAQINGRDELPIPEKVQLDVEYMQRQSFWFDLKIIILTFLKVLKKDGIAH